MALRASPPADRVVSDLHETIVENLFDGVYYVDRDRRITYWNPAAERISGYGAEEVVGRRCFDNLLGHVDDAGRKLCFTACPLVSAMAKRRGTEAEIYLHHRDGHRVPVHVRCQPIREPSGEVVGAVEIFNEDRAYRAAVDRIDRLERLSTTDGLTGVMNRRAAEVSLASRLRASREAGWPLGLVFLDIDHFKALNDELGHAAGDRVLRTVARSIAGAVRESDLVSRWGGEEFMLVSACSDEAEIGQLSERVRRLVASSTTTIDGRRRGVTVSVGATLAAAADTRASLVGRADRAMYASKLAGRNRTTIL